MISGIAKSLAFLILTNRKIAFDQDCCSQWKAALVMKVLPQSSAAEVSCNVFSKTAGRILCAIVIG